MWYHRCVNRAEMRRRLAQRPNAVRYEELARLLTAYGFEERSSGHGTSHRIWRRGASTISVPFRKPHVKPIYVRRVLQETEGEN